MKRAHWLYCGGGLLALVVVLLVAGLSAASALLIAVLLACPLLMLSTFATTRMNRAADADGGNLARLHQPTERAVADRQPLCRGLVLHKESMISFDKINNT
jgi:hypothetical protein